MRKSGAFYSSQRKEYEPLGQEVLPTEPVPEEWDTQQAMSRPFTVDEPEWKCRVADGMGRSFFEMPMHCQITQLEGGNLFLGDLLSANTENNPKKIVLTDSPLPDFGNYSGANEMLNYALSSSAKKDKKKKQSKTLAQVNIPISFDAPLIDMTDTGGIDASQSGQQPQQIEKRALTGQEISAFKKELADSMTPDCATFLSHFFRNLAEQREDLAFSSKNAFAICELFDEVASYTNVGSENFGFFYGSKTQGAAGRLPNKKPVVDFINSPNYTDFNKSSLNSAGEIFSFRAERLSSGNRNLSD